MEQIKLRWQVRGFTIVDKNLISSEEFLKQYHNNRKKTRNVSQSSTSSIESEELELQYRQAQKIMKKIVSKAKDDRYTKLFQMFGQLDQNASKEEESRQRIDQHKAMINVNNVA